MQTILTRFMQVNDLNEIIFANRNKAYGAYQLRKHYNERLLKALGATLLFILLLLLMNSIIHHYRKPPQVDRSRPVIIIDSIKTILIEKDLKPEVQGSVHETYVEKLPTEIVGDSVLKPQMQDSAITTVPPASGSTGNAPFTGKNIHGGTGGAAIIDSINTGAQPFTLNPEVMPSFPGGPKAFERYIRNRFMPDASGLKGDVGKIILQFVVTKSGDVTQIKIMHNDLGIDAAEQAKKFLLNSPQWNPGLQNDNAVNVLMVLPISIQKQ